MHTALFSYSRLQYHARTLHSLSFKAALGARTSAGRADQVQVEDTVFSLVPAILIPVPTVLIISFVFILGVIRCRVVRCKRHFQVQRVSPPVPHSFVGAFSGCGRRKILCLAAAVLLRGLFGSVCLHPDSLHSAGLYGRTNLLFLQRRVAVICFGAND